jgi:chromosome partitioning protein
MMAMTMSVSRLTSPFHCGFMRAQLRNQGTLRNVARRLLFTSQKGGVGKSTLARSTAVALASRGRQVLLADFDSEQQTALRWQAQRRIRGIAPPIPAAGFSKARHLDRIAHGYDDLVIDTPGGQDAVSPSLAVSADFVFLPSSFSLDDIAPTLKLVQALRSAGVTPAHMASAFCRTGGSRRQEQQARSILAMNQIASLSVVLPQKDGFATLYATGRVGSEAANRHLRATALAFDEAILAFVGGIDGSLKGDDGTSR